MDGDAGNAGFAEGAFAHRPVTHRPLAQGGLGAGEQVANGIGRRGLGIGAGRLDRKGIDPFVGHRIGIVAEVGEGIIGAGLGRERRRAPGIGARREFVVGVEAGVAVL